MAVVLEGVLACCLTFGALELRAGAGLAEGDAPPASAARVRVERGVQEALALLHDTQLSRPERSERVVKMVSDAMDFEVLGHLALGQKWDEIPQMKRAEFVGELRKHIFSICLQGVDLYTNEELLIVSDRAEARGDWSVQTRAIGKKTDGSRREVAKVDFRMRQREEQWRIIDVTIEGFSLAATMRAEFAVIMKDGGIEKLIQLLREKNAARK
jgi:phospholipid transport system substrate-binding protein